MIDDHLGDGTTAGGFNVQDGLSQSAAEVESEQLRCFRQQNV